MRLNIASLVIMLAPMTAAAMIPCLPRRTNMSDMRDASTKAMDVVLVGEADRQNATDYGLNSKHMTPEAVESRYAATGDLVCTNKSGKSFAGQAQVTLKNNVLTTAAHALMNAGDCKNKVSPANCEFTLRVAGKDQKYVIESIAVLATNVLTKGQDQRVMTGRS